MNFKNPILTPVILPLLTFLVLSIIKCKNDTEVIWTEYGLLLLFMFALWAVTAFIGAFISYLTERKKLQIVVTVTLQAVLIAGFSYYFSIKQPLTIDKDENMKMNRLMIDYQKRLNDSLATFPNSIRIAFKKLESKFSNPNDFKLTYFGSEKRDLLSDTTSLYFQYMVHDTIELYSKIRFVKDTAYVLTFNKSIDDTEFLNLKRRLNERRLEDMKHLLEKSKNGGNTQ